MTDERARSLADDPSPALAGTAAEASRQTASAVDPAYNSLSAYLCLASTARFGASMRAGPGQPSAAVLRAIAAQITGEYTICVGYAELQKWVARHLDTSTERTLEPLTESRII